MIYICDWYLVIADSKLYLVILPTPHASSWQTDGNRSQKGALTHDKNLSSKPEQQKWPPKVSGTVIAMNGGVVKCEKGSRRVWWEKSAGWTVTCKGMGKARLRQLGRHRDKPGSFPQTWTCKWPLSLTTSVSHREKSGISSGSPCVTGSSQFLLTLTTYSVAKCNALRCYLPVIC